MMKEENIILCNLLYAYMNRSEKRKFFEFQFLSMSLEMYNFFKLVLRRAAFMFLIFQRKIGSSIFFSNNCIREENSESSQFS